MTILDYADRAPSEEIEGEAVLSAVLCGSFRRDPEGLQAVFAELGRHFHVLSPRAVDFVDDTADFVRLPEEVDEGERQIEERHLSALATADLVWLHAPSGYVGTSAAMELGHAAALGVPVFAACAPDSAVLAGNVTVVSSPAAIEAARLADIGLPGNGLQRLQRYYKAAALRRGWSHESARDTLLLLTEELGELARAVRKSEGIARHQEWAAEDVGAELADVQLYLVHLANVLALDLSVAVTDKERVNARRFKTSRVA